MTTIWLNSLTRLAHSAADIKPMEGPSSVTPPNMMSWSTTAVRMRQLTNLPNSPQAARPWARLLNTKVRLVQ